MRRSGVRRFAAGSEKNGPEQAWFDKTWRPSEVELVE
jgi:hypothetical protein